MAAQTWPYNLAWVHFAGYERGAGPEARRTPFQDGLVRQEETVSEHLETRTFTITVRQSNKTAFDAWRRGIGVDKFNFRDPEDQVQREVSIVGGYSGVSLSVVENERYKGERIWRGRLTVEGLWSAVVA